MLEHCLHLAARVDVLEICVKDDLQQHAGRKTACPAPLYVASIALMSRCSTIASRTHWIIFRDKVTDTVRKKKRIVLIVRFIRYLCHVKKVEFML